MVITKEKAVLATQKSMIKKSNHSSIKRYQITKEQQDKKQGTIVSVRQFENN